MEVPIIVRNEHVNVALDLHKPFSAPVFAKRQQEEGNEKMHLGDLYSLS